MASNENDAIQSETNKFFDIDGSLLEGGGQVLRIAIALSAIKRIPVRIFNIRAGRSKPGLGEQHLRGLILVKDMCGGQLKGAEIGSQEIFFTPRLIQSGHFEARVKTAGSVVLLMQVCIPVALFAPGVSTFTLWGGTDADMAPPIDYMSQVTTNVFRRFGAQIEINLIKRGFFPRGGGEVFVRVKNAGCLKPVTLVDPGAVTSIVGTSVVGGSCPMRIAHEMKKGADTILFKYFGSHIESKIKVQQCPADCPGSSITILAHTSSGCVLAGSAIGSRKQQPHDTGSQAANDLMEAKPGIVCFDPHAQDQIILPMALASGLSKILCGPLTLHTKTAITIVEMLCKAKFEIQENDFSNIITCTGDPS